MKTYANLPEIIKNDISDIVKNFSEQHLQQACEKQLKNWLDENNKLK